jgi:hypothetical protein
MPAMALEQCADLVRELCRKSEQCHSRDPVDGLLSRQRRLRLDPLDVQDVVARQSEIDAELGEHRSPDPSDDRNTDGALEWVVWVDFDGSAACYLKFEEVTCVIRGRLDQRLQSDSVLTGFSHVRQVDVIRRAAWIKPQQQRHTPFDDPPLGLRFEQAGNSRRYAISRRRCCRNSGG